MKFLPWLVAGALTMVGAAAQTPAHVIQAEIVATQSKGDVTIAEAGRAPSAVAGGKQPVVSTGATVRTGDQASVVLVFSNGLTVQLRERSELLVEQFLQDPFPATINVANVTQEPTVSVVALRLVRGELVGSAPTLNLRGGSKVTVRTAAGVLASPARDSATARDFQGGVFRLSFGGKPATGEHALLVAAGGSPWVFTPANGGEAKSMVIPPGQQIEVVVRVEAKGAAAANGGKQP